MLVMARVSFVLQNIDMSKSGAGMSEDERGAKALREGRTLTDMHMLVVRAYHAQTNYLRAQVAHAGLGPG